MISDVWAHASAARASSLRLRAIKAAVRLLSSMSGNIGPTRTRQQRAVP
jgi:hypothetical protein